MDKGPEAFRTISEVADILGVPQHVLRFWETRFFQIKPVKRAGGRRYYRPSDIEFLKGIKYLLYDKGYTIIGVKKLLKEKGVAFAIALGSGDTLVANRIFEEKQHSEHDDLLLQNIPSARSRSGRNPGIFGLLKLDGSEKEGIKKHGLSVAGRELLQEVLFDLIECKRLLDRACTG